MRTGYKCTRIWNLFQKIQYMNFSPLTNWKLRMTEKVYVPEGTNCNSFGILRIKIQPSNLKLETKNFGKKPRLRFKDRNETFINLSYTGDDVVTQECIDLQTDVLMIVGFGRPWEGNKKIPFPIKRCYLIAVGIVYRNYISYQIEACL